jgi:hypothetical protein
LCVSFVADLSASANEFSDPSDFSFSFVIEDLVILGVSSVTSIKEPFCPFIAFSSVS